MAPDRVAPAVADGGAFDHVFLVDLDAQPRAVRNFHEALIVVEHPIKFAKAMGAEVTLFTRSASKAEEGRRQGADHVIVSTDAEQMKAAAGYFDFLLDTIPVQHDLNPYLDTLRFDGVHILVGLIEPVNPPVHAGKLVMSRRVLAGSLIGGIAETQEVLDFCAEHNITCDIEMLDIRNINEAYARMIAGDVKYRFVIDMATLKA